MLGKTITVAVDDIRTYGAPLALVAQVVANHGKTTISKSAIADATGLTVRQVDGALLAGQNRGLLERSDEGPGKPATWCIAGQETKPSTVEVAVVKRTSTVAKLERREDAEKLCGLLAKCIGMHRNGAEPKVTPTWIRDMGALLQYGPKGQRQAKRQPQEVARAIEIIFTKKAEPRNGFCWADHIQSPSGLREKWHKIGLDRELKLPTDTAIVEAGMAW